jgi:hypothetical protein
MLRLLQYVLAAMLAWVPPSQQGPAEAGPVAQARYERIAQDIASVALDPNVDPLFDGDDGRARTAILLASIASHESMFSRAVDEGVVRGDHGVAWGLWQVHCYRGEACRELIRDRLRGAREALRIARLSMHACRGMSLSDRLSVYTTGRCVHGQHESRVRVQRALDWMTRHPWRGCPSDMADAGRFCIDRYEAPNRRGAKPLAFITAAEGAAWCARKRLCTDAEWTAACAGARGPCNDQQRWRPVDWGRLDFAQARTLYQATPSGAHAGCVSSIGAFDMLGNVAEWVAAPVGLRGGFWSGAHAVGRPSCAFANRVHPPSFRTYEAGVRCCRSLA